MKTIFLDFDGVLFDTAKEAYLLSKYAYNEKSPFEKINDDEYYVFYANKYLVANSWQYYYLIQAIENHEEIEKYFPLKITNRDEQDLIFDKRFQNCRKDLIKNHSKFWNDLDTPYPFFYEIKKMINEFDIVIVSTKNISAIDNKLKQHGFNISQDKIIGKEILVNYISKGDFLSKYIKANNIDNAILIDDSQENLDSCKSINNIQLLLANWGYCNPKIEGLSYQEILNKIKEGV